MEIAQTCRIEPDDDLLGFSAQSARRRILNNALQTLKPEFLPIGEYACLGHLASHEISAMELPGFFYGKQIGFFLNDEYRALVPVRVPADIAEAARLVMHEKAPFADLDIRKIIQVLCKGPGEVLAPPREIKHEPRRLARSDRGQFGQVFNKSPDGFRQFRHIPYAAYRRF